MGCYIIRAKKILKKRIGNGHKIFLALVTVSILSGLGPLRAEKAQRIETASSRASAEHSQPAALCAEASFEFRHSHIHSIGISSNMPYLLLPRNIDDDGYNDSEEALLAESDPATAEEYAESNNMPSKTLTATNLRTRIDRAFTGLFGVRIRQG